MTHCSAPYAPSVLARFWAKVDKDAPGGCWLWTAGLNRYGYGKFSVSRADRVPAHRFAYLLAQGALAPGLEIDHTCHGQDSDCAGGVTCLHRRCVNPAHLEAVTHRENMLRGRTIAAESASKTHCPKGHPYNEANTYRYGGRRSCRPCRRARRRKTA